jgi:predicted O-methyltransferase YrrM
MNTELKTKLEDLKKEHPWPSERPTVLQNLTGGWFHSSNQRKLKDWIEGNNPNVIVELGSWMGLSTRFLCENSNATVIAVDHFEGSREHQRMPELKTLYETFVTNCWEWRDKIIILRMDTVKALTLLAYRFSIEPDLVYVDASHEEGNVYRDVSSILELFPTTHIIGDDFCWDGVRAAVKRVAKDYTKALEVLDNVSWSFE